MDEGLVLVNIQNLLNEKKSKQNYIDYDRLERGIFCFPSLSLYTSPIIQ
jgi:hypothetical protein